MKQTLFLNTSFEEVEVNKRADLQQVEYIYFGNLKLQEQFQKRYGVTLIDDENSENHLFEKYNNVIGSWINIEMCEKDCKKRLDNILYIKANLNEKIDLTIQFINSVCYCYDYNGTQFEPSTIEEFNDKTALIVFKDYQSKLKFHDRFPAVEFDEEHAFDLIFLLDYDNYYTSINQEISYRKTQYEDAKGSMCRAANRLNELKAIKYQLEDN